MLSVGDVCRHERRQSVADVPRIPGGVILLSAESLEVSVREEGGAAVVAVVGEVTARAEKALESAFSRAAAARPRMVVLDLGGVAYMNSAGIALIVSLIASARRAGLRLSACRLHPHYAEIFAITRLSDYLAVYPDVASALAVADEPTR
jgi:anti-anti-sigma factor